MPDVLGTCLNISAPLKSLLRSPRVATPDYNQGNERREATSPRELKRASALKEKGVPKATTQDSCFSHMICKGQSLREQPVEVRRAGEGQKVSPAHSPAPSRRLRRASALTKHGRAAWGSFGNQIKKGSRHLGIPLSACRAPCYAGLGKTFSSSTPRSCRVIS